MPLRIGEADPNDMCLCDGRKFLAKHEGGYLAVVILRIYPNNDWFWEYPEYELRRCETCTDITELYIIVEE